MASVWWAGILESLFPISWWMIEEGVKCGGAEMDVKLWEFYEWT